MKRECIDVVCKSCKCVLEAESDDFGKQCACPNCGNIIDVPDIKRSAHESCAAGKRTNFIERKRQKLTILVLLAVIFVFGSAVCISVFVMSKSTNAQNKDNQSSREDVAPTMSADVKLVEYCTALILDSHNTLDIFYFKSPVMKEIRENLDAFLKGFEARKTVEALTKNIEWALGVQAKLNEINGEWLKIADAKAKWMRDTMLLSKIEFEEFLELYIKEMSILAGAIEYNDKVRYLNDDEKAIVRKRYSRALGYEAPAYMCPIHEHEKLEQGLFLLLFSLKPLDKKFVEIDEKRLIRTKKMAQVLQTLENK